MVTNQEPESYWDWFYSDARFDVDDIPSQFAAFSLGEFRDADLLFDIGCGTGRDSFFFSRYIDRINSLDSSTAAIEYCNRKITHQDLSNIQTTVANIQEFDELKEIFLAELESSSFPVLYARFFLHAIDESGQDGFLRLAELISSHNGYIAVEFRTQRDEQQAKVTQSHYRRYINPLEFMEHAQSYGLSLIYFAEGFGFAKYKNDDAHVARIVLK